MEAAWRESAFFAGKRSFFCQNVNKIIFKKSNVDLATSGPKDIHAHNNERYLLLCSIPHTGVPTINKCIVKWLLLPRLPLIHNNMERPVCVTSRVTVWIRSRAHVQYRNRP